MINKIKKIMEDRKVASEIKANQKMYIAGLDRLNRYLQHKVSIYPTEDFLVLPDTKLNRIFEKYFGKIYTKFTNKEIRIYSDNFIKNVSSAVEILKKCDETSMYSVFLDKTEGYNATTIEAETSRSKYANSACDIKKLVGRLTDIDKLDLPAPVYLNASTLNNEVCVTTPIVQ